MIYQLGLAYMRMREWEKCGNYFKRAKRGFENLLGKGAEKTIEVTKSLAIQIYRGDELINQLTLLLERAKKSLGENKRVYALANSLGIELESRSRYNEAMKYKVMAFEGRKKLLGADAKDTLASLMNLGVLYRKMGNCKGAIECYERCLKLQEKVRVFLEIQQVALVI